MNLNLKGRSIIVTGASKGLGKAIATEFALAGAHVLISSRNEALLCQTAAEIKEKTNNKNIDYAVCDMKDEAQIDHLVNVAKEKFSTVDVLINNTGGPKAGNFFDMDDSDWYDAFELNVLSFVRTIRHIVPLMKKQERGHIINLTSLSMKQTLDDLILSNTMRPGILGLTKSLSQELAPDNILINTVGPGFIETDRLSELNEKRAKEKGVSVEELKEVAEQSVPMRRLGQPEEFAKAVVFLASGANTYITGQSLIIDGGLVKAL